MTVPSSAPASRKPDYSYWRDALAGKKPPMYVDEPELGFYRRGVYKKEEGKRARRIGWTPVAIYFGTAGLVAQIGPHLDDTRYQTLDDRDQINELWSYVAGHPISEEWYRAVAERGEPWPDSHEAVQVPAEVAEVLTSASDDRSAADKIAASIKADTALIEKFKAIDSDEMASRARSLQNKLLDSRSAAEKEYNTANRPLIDAQKKLREVWFPLRDAADAGCKALRDAIGKWNDQKLAAAKQAEAEGRSSNMPPPSTQIRGGAGRAAAIVVKKIVTSIDVDKAFKQFRESDDVRDVLMRLSQKAINAGISVDGAVIEEKSDLR